MNKYEEHRKEAAALCRKIEPLFKELEALYVCSTSQTLDDAELACILGDIMYFFGGFFQMVSTIIPKSMMPVVRRFTGDEISRELVVAFKTLQELTSMSSVMEYLVNSRISVIDLETTVRH